MKNRILSLLAVLAVAVSMVGCTEQTATSAETTEQIIAETTSEVFENQTSQTEKDYSEYEEFPDGWSAERIFNMISIDGYQLPFPCKVDDILNLSNDFDVRNEHYHSETVELAELFYKNVEIADIAYYTDEQINYIYISDFHKTGYIKIENIDINDTEKMNALVETLIIPSTDESGMLRAKFKDNAVGFIVNYFNTTNTVVISWEENNNE